MSDAQHSELSTIKISPAAPPIDLRQDSVLAPPPSPSVRKGKAVTAGILGGVLLAICLGVMGFSEYRDMMVARTLAEGGQAVQEASAERIHAIQNGKLIHVAGKVLIPGTLTDPDFAAFHASNAAVLRRAVETYQWNESRHTNRSGMSEFTYSRVWLSKIIDSSEFHEPSGHENNPPRYLESQLVAPEAAMGVRRVPSALLALLDGGDPLSPAATPLPSGTQMHDGALYVGRNPDSPKIGDQRIRWTAIQPTELSVIAEQQGPGFGPYRATSGRDLQLIAVGLLPAAELIHQAEVDEAKFSWEIRAGCSLVMFAGFVLLLSWAALLDRAFPIVGKVAGVGVVLGALALMLITASVVIGLPLLVRMPAPAGGGMLGCWMVALGLLWLNRVKQARRGSAAGPPAHT